MTIAERLGIANQGAHKLYTTTLAAIPALEVAEYRAEQAERLDALLAKANEVLAAGHVVIQHGRVVMQDGKPVRDHGPVLDAIKTVLAIEKQRAELFEFKVPVKQQIQTAQTVTSFKDGDLDDLRQRRITRPIPGQWHPNG
ncbi:hypothetical protein ACGFNP_11420 [Nonomuraea sp. NPDC049269]|uniref:hypothetical protein n=1 Tax=Nonomuraea sp. NPDC049269 TaxID=3364349 RepID=UPI0037103A36